MNFKHNSPELEWQIAISRNQRRKKRKQERCKKLQPYAIEHPQNSGIIDIPVLFELWPNVLTEIVKHVQNPDLLQLRRVCWCLMKHCNKEINERKQKTRFWPTYTEIKQFCLNNQRMYRRYKMYGSDLFSLATKSSIITPHYIRLYRRYKKSIRTKLCEYYSYGLYAGLHDPTCKLCFDNLNSDWYSVRIKVLKQLDVDLLVDTDVDILLNPKIKLSLLNSKV